MSLQDDMLNALESVQEAADARGCPRRPAAGRAAGRGVESREHQTMAGSHPSHPDQVSAADFPPPVQAVTRSPAKSQGPGRERNRFSGYMARGQGEAARQIRACQSSAHDQKAHSGI
jgi:hypothetical protein